MPSFSTLSLTAALVVAAAAQQPSCDIVGYDSGSVLAFLVRENEALADRLACGQLCAGNTRCGSFAFGDGACLLYEETVEGNVYEAETSPYTFNDLACVEGKVEVPVEGEDPPTEEEPPTEGEEPPADDTPVEEEPPADGQ